MRPFFCPMCMHRNLRTAPIQRQSKAQECDGEFRVSEGSDAAQLGREERRSAGNDLRGDEGNKD